MPRRTKKYVGALLAKREAKLTGRYADQEALYQALQGQGYQWDSKAGEWQYVAAMPADEPTTLLRLRVWSGSDRVVEVANAIAWAMAQAGCRLVERAGPFPCRPPKQLEARMYLALEIPERVAVPDEQLEVPALAVEQVRGLLVGWYAELEADNARTCAFARGVILGMETALVTLKLMERRDTQLLRQLRAAPEGEEHNG